LRNPAPCHRVLVAVQPWVRDFHDLSQTFIFASLLVNNMLRPFRDTEKITLLYPTKCSQPLHQNASWSLSKLARCSMRSFTENALAQFETCGSAR